MSLTNLERALLHAAKAFLQAYTETKSDDLGVGSHQPQQKLQSRPTASSNGIPVCSIHGKAMRPSKYKEGQYYCGARLDDDTYCREKA